MAAYTSWRRSSFSSSNGGNCVEVAWRRSSFSSSNGGSCVEVAWRRSSFSGSNGGDCVEVAPTLGALRDSKDPSGPVLTGRVDLLVRHLKQA